MELALIQTFLRGMNSSSLQQPVPIDKRPKSMNRRNLSIGVKVLIVRLGLWHVGICQHGMAPLYPPQESAVLKTEFPHKGQPKRKESRPCMDFRVVFGTFWYFKSSVDSLSAAHHVPLHLSTLRGRFRAGGFPYQEHTRPVCWPSCGL